MNIKTFKMFEEESNILNTKEKVGKWLDSMEIEKYTINDDLTVDVDGDVDLDRQDFENFPVKFGTVKGYFDCNNCSKLVSLEGAPEIVKERFWCCSCLNLTSLKGAPKEVSGSFYCYQCPNLVSLEDAPKKVGRSFDCSDTPIKNLFNDTSFTDFAKMNDQEKENFIIEAFKENRIDERVFKANVSKEKQIAYKGLVSGKKFGI